MRKLYIILITVLLVMSSSVGFSAENKGDGSAPVDSGTQFSKPRGFGEEASQDENESHERMFNEAAPGAWSKDPEPGKDKPSDEAKDK